MKYDFDEVIERRGTSCVKYDLAKRRGKSPDLLPLWVADMDFRIPQPAIEALKARAEHGIFGYSEPLEGYFEAVTSWVERHHGWRPDAESLVITPGVVFALALSVRVFTQPGDAVIIQPPVYYPFRSVIRESGREVVAAPLVERDGRYEMDFETFEREVRRTRPKLFFLCNPHNPVGRAWTREELERVGSICLANDVLVVADEIHADFARPGFKHVAFAGISPAFAQASIVCTAPSKTFNLAGLQISNIFIPNDDVRREFKEELLSLGCDNANAMGLVAAEACFREGEEWLDQLKDYLEGNLDFLRSFLLERLPKVKLVEPESTYLTWLDMRGLGLSHSELIRLVEDEAKLWLDHGAMFGREGEGFMRINMATQRATIKQALVQLAGAIEARG